MIYLNDKVIFKFRIISGNKRANTDIIVFDICNNVQIRMLSYIIRNILKRHSGQGTVKLSSHELIKAQSIARSVYHIDTMCPHLLLIIIMRTNYLSVTCSQKIKLAYPVAVFITVLDGFTAVCI